MTAVKIRGVAGNPCYKAVRPKDGTYYVSKRQAISNPPEKKNGEMVSGCEVLDEWNCYRQRSSPLERRGRLRCLARDRNGSTIERSVKKKRN